MTSRSKEIFKSLPLHGKTMILLLSSLGKDQTWLAEQCGVTPSMVNHVISGRAIPSLPVALRISKSLGISVDLLFKELG